MLARAAVDGQRAEPGRPDGPHGSRMRGGSRREETGETGTWLIEGPFEGPSSYRPLRGR